MVIRIKSKEENRIFKIYLLAMFGLMVVRYILKINVPAAAFLLVAMLPICFGTTSEQLAFVASCIPLSAAFQYKYALLILCVAMLMKKRWKLKRSGAFFTVMVMMAWELWHAFYGRFSFVEYLRDFAELIILGIVTSIDADELDYKLIIRSLSISVVGVCSIMLFMQMQQFGFDLIAVFARSAKSFRFGQSNMAAGRFALNFNANNLGYICNLSTCGCLLLATRKEHSRWDVILAIASFVFALMTLSRSAMICATMIFFAFLVLVEGDLLRKMLSGVGGLLLIVIILIVVNLYIPTIFENILERFQRADIWNGRGGLLLYYTQFMLSSWKYLLFGIGMQQIFEKVSPHYPVHEVPHMGLQEVWIAWGVVGLLLFFVVFWKIITTSKQYAHGKRQPYQFMAFALTVVYTCSAQLLTSSRALMALSISYVFLCMRKQVK